MFLDVIDQPSHVLLLLNPTNEIDRRLEVQSQQFVDAIRQDSMNQLMFRINVGSRYEALQHAQNYLIDHHAIEHGANRSRSEVRGQAKAYLNLFRRN